MVLCDPVHDLIKMRCQKKYATLHKLAAQRNHSISLLRFSKENILFELQEKFKYTYHHQLQLLLPVLNKLKTIASYSNLLKVNFF